MELHQRLTALIDARYDRSAAKLADKLDIHPNTFRGYLSEEGQEKIKLSVLTRIFEITPGLNRDWLFFGEGPMFRGKAPEPRESVYEIKGLAPHAKAGTARLVREPGDGEKYGYIVEVHAEAGAGPASEHWEPEPMARACIPPEFWRQSLIVLKIKGDSMEPRIKRGAFVGVDIGDRDYVRGDIYAVYVPYEGLTVKRVSHDPAERALILESINPSHSPMRLPIEQREGLIVGRVVWVMQAV